MPKVPKIRSLDIFAMFPEKMGNEADFLCADKHESFLQVDNINLGVCSQAFPKYPSNKFAKIFAISREKREG